MYYIVYITAHTTRFNVVIYVIEYLWNSNHFKELCFPLCVCSVYSVCPVCLIDIVYCVSQGIIIS